MSEDAEDDLDLSPDAWVRQRIAELGLGGGLLGAFPGRTKESAPASTRTPGRRPWYEPSLESRVKGYEARQHARRPGWVIDKPGVLGG